MSSATLQAQITLYETTLEDPELEQLLEKREVAKELSTHHRKTFAELNDDAKVRIKDLDLGDAPVRVGRFLISEREVSGRNVSFETAPSSRVQISLLPTA